MFAIAMIDPPLACPLAVLATIGIISVGVCDWVPAIVESPNFHWAHLDLSEMSGGGEVALLYVGPGAEIVQRLLDRGCSRPRLENYNGF